MEVVINEQFWCYFVRTVQGTIIRAKLGKRFFRRMEPGISCKGYHRLGRDIVQTDVNLPML
jgi:hypothetical protein